MSKGSTGRGESVLTPRGNTLPETVHATLTAAQVGSGQIIVIGDIHGCSDELDDLLQKCKFEAGLDTLVSVGDLVGKGPNSVEVLRAAQRLGMLTVRGNWDDQALKALRAWKAGEVLKDHWRWLERTSEADEAYMNAMPFSLALPSHGCLVAHAGLVPGVPLERQHLEDLIEMRHVDVVEAGEAAPAKAQRWRALPKHPRDAGKPWATVWPGPEHIIFGHHARRGLQACSYASGIDTACCLGDRLTALVLPPVDALGSAGREMPSWGVTRESIGASFVSVPARRQYVAPDAD